MEISGLSSLEAERRLKIYGKNEIVERKGINPFFIFLSQFKSPIILLLIAAAILSLFVNVAKEESFIDSLLILAIVFAAGIAGFVQDYKAEKTIEALKKLATPKAKVIRDGKEQEIDSTLIVPGDIIVLEGGDVIPADAELIKGELQVDESILTGESRAVKKKVGDKIFSGCGIFSGNAIAKVIATGMNTQLGKIASKVQEIREEKTPFQLQMERFTKKIVLLTILIIFGTLFVAVKKFGFVEGALIAVSLAVAAIPENLPAVITLALSLGARQMARKNALVRKLVITESIGTVDVICTDKTGTITEGKMKVKEIWFLEKSEKAEKLAIECCYYCNNAKKVLKGKEEKWVGDETDIALKIFSLNFSEKLREGKRIGEIPFTSERKMMSVAYDFGEEKIIYAKGAPEILLKKCSKVMKGDSLTKLTDPVKKEILRKNDEFASKAYRILALAYKKFEGKLEEKDLIFLGLIVLYDPPRKEVKEAIKECYSAGIRVIMITGDNPLTAKAIAEEVGIKTEGVITGEQLDKMNEEQLAEALNRGVNIFARTSPFHKLKILEILKRQGHVVAMTGDGVNDALALKKADVGIAMGIKGSEVAKEASDIILLDDNFATIRTAIREGRRIFDNIRKFVDYLLTCNVAEVFVVLLSTLLFPFILLYPPQILWVNLVTDGLPALALSVDPARPDVMKRKPRKKEEGIINKRLALLIGSIGFKKAMVVLGTFLAAFSLGLGLEKARTTLFTGFIMYEFVRIAVIRYNEKMFSFKEWLRNRFLLISLIISFLLQLLIIYSPLSSIFKTVPIGFTEWIILVVGTLIGFATGIFIAYLVREICKEEY